MLFCISASTDALVNCMDGKMTLSFQWAETRAMKFSTPKTDVIFYSRNLQATPICAELILSYVSTLRQLLLSHLGSALHVDSVYMETAAQAFLLKWLAFKTHI